MLVCHRCSHVYSWNQMGRLLKLPLEVDTIPLTPNSGKSNPCICMYCGAVINVPVGATEVSLLEGLLAKAKDEAREREWKREMAEKYGDTENM